MATTFVRAANPIWWLPDLTGVSLNDEYYAFFLTNTLPYIPQSVYQDPAGATQWSNPVQFSPAGTLPDNLYFDPTLVYRIEVRHGSTQADALIWEINDFVPGSDGGGSIITDELTVAANLITNPQFADITFQSPFTYTTVTPGTYTLDVAPGWQLILTGTGTTVLTQTAVAGSSNIVGNPPYYLDINNTGWTSATLRQRLENNGAIFANGAIAVAFTAAAVTTPETLTVTYAPDSGTSTNIFQQSIPVGALTAYSGAVDLPASSNASTGTSAYVNIDFVLPGTGELQLTNIQIVGQSENLSSSFDVDTDIPAFRELSYEQVENGEFNVYRDDLIYKQIPSYLVGWDFPLNPAQFLGDTVAPQAVGANKSFYAWDSTIIFQSVNSSISVARGSGGNISIVADLAGQVAIIQYLEVTQARKLLCQDICANICALAAPNNVNYTISLWYTTDASLPDIKSGTSNSLVATLDANGKPATFNGSWTEVPNSFSQPATYTIGGPIPGGTEWNDYSHVGWALNDNNIANTVTFMAIVIGTASMAQNDAIDINSISLQAGNIPTRPAPQTADEVLRECEYFYEKSYGDAINPGTASTLINANFAEQYVNDVAGAPHTLSLKSRGYMVKCSPKVIATGIVTFYSPVTGTADRVRGYTVTGAAPLADADIVQSTAWTLVSTGEKALVYLPSNTTDLVGPTNAVVSFPEAYILYHYTIDCRLGTY